MVGSMQFTDPESGERITYEGGKAAFPATYRRCLPLMLAMLREIYRLHATSSSSGKREPLSEQRIVDITEHIGARNGYYIAIARAVEAAHGICHKKKADHGL